MLPSCMYSPPWWMAWAGGQCLNFKWPEAFRKGVFLLWSRCIWPLLYLLGHTTDQDLTPDGKKRPSRKDYPKMHQKAVLLALPQISERFPHQNVLVCHFRYVLNY